jgi:hypothetical protein
MSDEQNDTDGLAPDADRQEIDGEQPGVLNTLSETAQKFLDDPGTDAAAGRDLPDDASGEEPPQDGDPAR